MKSKQILQSAKIMKPGKMKGVKPASPSPMMGAEQAAPSPMESAKGGALGVLKANKMSSGMGMGASQPSSMYKMMGAGDSPSNLQGEVELGPTDAQYSPVLNYLKKKKGQ